MDFYEPAATQWEREMLDLRKRILGALILILLVTIAGIGGFLVIDPDAGVVRAFFMTAITLTTVGYGEEIPLDTSGAQIFTAVLILLGMGATLYFVSTTTAFLVEGELGNLFRRKRMERTLADLSGHVIVCGATRTARYAAGELAAVKRDVVLVVPSQEEAEEASRELDDALVVVGDPTDDDILRAAGVERADGIIASSHSDNENVVITLSARHLNPAIRVVSKVQDVQQMGKVRKVGADSVVSPQHIGGLRLASELIRPTVVDFLDTMLRDRDRNLRIAEVEVPAGSRLDGTRLRDAGLDGLPGVLLLAVRSGDGRWAYNPSRDTTVHAGQTLIFMGSPDDEQAMQALVRTSGGASAGVG